MLYFSRWKIFGILSALLIGLLIASPNVMPQKMRDSLPGFMPSETINLGLDLQGGAHLLLETDMEDVINRVLENEMGSVRAVLRDDRIRVTSLKSDGVLITGKFSQEDDAEKGFTLLDTLASPIGQNTLGGPKTLKIEKLSSVNFRITPTTEYLEDITKRTIDQSIDTLRKRIDPTGTTEMTLAREGDNRILLQVPGAKDVAVESFSLSKSYNMPGWRVGFLVGNPVLIAALARMKSYLDYGMFAPIQIASIFALEAPEAKDWVSDIREMYQKRRDVLCDGLVAAGWPVEKPKATMFAWAKIPEPFLHMGSMEFSKLLLEKAKVAVSPGVGFGDYGDDYVRFGLIENEHRIRQAVRSIKAMMRVAAV